MTMTTLPSGKAASLVWRPDINPTQVQYHRAVEGRPRLRVEEVSRSHHAMEGRPKMTAEEVRGDAGSQSPPWPTSAARRPSSQPWPTSVEEGDGSQASATPGRR